MNEIKKFAKDKDIKIIEDCSQAHGAKFKEKCWKFWRYWNI